MAGGEVSGEAEGDERPSKASVKLEIQGSDSNAPSVLGMCESPMLCFERLECVQMVLKYRDGVGRWYG